MGDTWSNYQSDILGGEGLQGLRDGDVVSAVFTESVGVEYKYLHCCQPLQYLCRKSPLVIAVSFSIV